MPLDTRTYDLAETIDELDDTRREKAEAQADYPPDSQAAQQLAAEGQQADRFHTGLCWLRDEFDVQSVTLSALTNGERRRVADTSAQTPYNRSDIYVAAGTHDAPWCEHDPDATTQDDFEETVRAITDLHPALVDWAEQEIGDLSHVDGETGKSYRALVLEARTRPDSTNESG